MAHSSKVVQSIMAGRESGLGCRSLGLLVTLHQHRRERMLPLEAPLFYCLHFVQLRISYLMVPSSSRVSHQLNLFGNAIPKDWFHVILNCQVDNEDEPAQNMDLFLGHIPWMTMSQCSRWHFQYDF